MSGRGGAALSEVFRALGVLSEPPGEGHAGVAQALGLAAVPDPSEYTDVFVFNLYPYASVYLGPEGQLGGDARDRVAGFWRALRFAVPAEPDHLAALLGLYAVLLDREAEDAEPARRLLWHQARAALLHEHLLSWLPPYLDRVDTVAPSSYRAWAALLRSALNEETEAVGRPGALCAHFRAAPPLPDPRQEGSHAFISGLLAPVRCGMILARADLARAARDLRLGLRVGERKLALAALLSQAPAAVLGWLAGEARRCAERDTARAQALGFPAVFWAERAVRAAGLLQELRDAAAEVGADSQAVEVRS